MARDKKKILIVDDSEMNRAILSDMLCSDFDILEAENGEEAISILYTHGHEISVMLLDIVMPVMDGFKTLEVLRKAGLENTVTVIMISADTSSVSVGKAYDMGVLDFITRPFDENLVKRRVLSTLMLVAKEKELENMVADQVYEREKDNKLMIAILSHLVEFRNGESGLHVLHIRRITEIILRKLIKRTDKYGIQKKDIPVICNAAALHDVGKILIPEEVINKPGKLTEEEFEIMKTHSLKGAEILQSLAVSPNEPLIKAGYEICRWHHERYDGKGYPDKLKGDEIPIIAQIVSLADVYDALTSERVYKPAYTHERAIQMITHGECGVFNPELLTVFHDVADEIRDELKNESLLDYSPSDVMDTVNSMMYGDEVGVSERTLTLLEHERTKYKFFAELSKEIQFEYQEATDIFQLSDWGAEYLNVPELIHNPVESVLGKEVFSEGDLAGLLEKFKSTTASEPLIEHVALLNLKGEQRWSKIVARSMWTENVDGSFTYTGAIGKVVDIHEDMQRIDSLQRKATHDSLTGLLNHAAAKNLIKPYLSEKNGKYVLCVFDLDHFKQANDTYGHLFGDEVLKCVANHLKDSIRDRDVAARMGGDEFLLFMGYGSVQRLRQQIERVYNKLCGKYEEFDISLSMGVACVSDCNGDYDTLFHMADEALYEVKRNGRGQFRFSPELLKREEVGEE